MPADLIDNDYLNIVAFVTMVLIAFFFIIVPRRRRHDPGYDQKKCNTEYFLLRDKILKCVDENDVNRMTGLIQVFYLRWQGKVDVNILDMYRNMLLKQLENQNMIA